MQWSDAAIPCVYHGRRQRDVKPGQSPYRALLETMELSEARLTLQLINDNNKVWMLTSFPTQVISLIGSIWTNMNRFLSGLGAITAGAV